MAFGKHKHSGEEIVYVIEGLLQYQIEGRPPVTLKAGEVLFIPAGAIHSAKNVSTRNGAELATYSRKREAAPHASELTLPVWARAALWAILAGSGLFIGLTAATAVISA